ncbi:hypothetical protein BY996DRAFT_6412465 [Phakopsora pachyrhizi]|nr:hypothetical protein BY996DRAFT_6412465 [Phakopsora pachyrhizi]
MNTKVIPEVQLPVSVSCPSQFFLQHDDVLSATLGNIFHSKSSSWKITLGSILALVKNRNSRIEGLDLPNYLPSGIKLKATMVLLLASGYSIWNMWVLKFARDIIAPEKFEPQKVATDNPLSVERALAGFLASCFSFNKNKSAVVPIEGLKGNGEPIKDPAAGMFKNLDDFVDKIAHVLIAINMVQAHSKFPDLP